MVSSGLGGSLCAEGTGMKKGVDGETGAMHEPSKV